MARSTKQIFQMLTQKWTHGTISISQVNDKLTSCESSDSVTRSIFSQAQLKFSSARVCQRSKGSENTNDISSLKAKSFDLYFLPTDFPLGCLRDVTLSGCAGRIASLRQSSFVFPQFGSRRVLFCFFSVRCSELSDGSDGHGSVCDEIPRRGHLGYLR